MSNRRQIYRAVAQSMSPTVTLSHEEIIKLVIPLVDEEHRLSSKQIKSATSKARYHTTRSSAQSSSKAGMAYLTSKTADHAFVKLVGTRYIQKNGEKTAVSGGCKSASQLKTQLAYLSQDGVVDLELYQYDALLGADQSAWTNLDLNKIDAVLANWDLTDQEHKVDQTSQFIVSFPPGTNEKLAAKTVRDWAEEMFTSEAYDTAHDYILAIHTDKEHVHGHVIVNRAGIDIETGERAWLKISNRSARNYYSMRQEQVRQAERNGIKLTAPSRLERGIIGGGDAPKNGPVTQKRLSKVDELAAMTAVLWHGQNALNIASVLTPSHPQFDRMIYTGRKLLNGEILDIRSKSVAHEIIPQEIKDPKQRLSYMLKDAITYLEKEMIPPPYRSCHQVPSSFEYMNGAQVPYEYLAKSQLVQKYDLNPEILSARSKIPPLIRAVTKLDQQWADEDITRIKKRAPDFTYTDYERLTTTLSRRLPKKARALQRKQAFTIER